MDEQQKVILIEKPSATRDDYSAAGTYRGDVKAVVRRDYSGGSLRDAIRRCESLAELDSLRKVILDIAGQGDISTGSLRKLERLGAKRFEYLRTRLIQAPPRGIVLPRSPIGSGIIIP